mmetsp:Transcript_93682/g.269786  ORF Transcript_93682/g.269786 Transcript_93682/m.269786 type:complete len:239 (-) Transcript_93682:309-1025(-)
MPWSKLLPANFDLPAVLHLQEHGARVELHHLCAQHVVLGRGCVPAMAGHHLESLDIMRRGPHVGIRLRRAGRGGVAIAADVYSRSGAGAVQRARVREVDGGGHNPGRDLVVRAGVWPHYARGAHRSPARERRAVLAGLFHGFHDDFLRRPSETLVGVGVPFASHRRSGARLGVAGLLARRGVLGLAAGAEPRACWRAVRGLHLVAPCGSLGARASRRPGARGHRHRRQAPLARTHGAQ